MFDVTFVNIIPLNMKILIIPMLDYIDCFFYKFGNGDLIKLDAWEIPSLA